MTKTSNEWFHATFKNKRIKMKNLFFLSLLALTTISCGQNVKANNKSEEVTQAENVSITSDSLSKAKKNVIMRCLIDATTGLHNVVVDHSKDVALIIGKTPTSNEEIIYQPDNHAPDEYIEFFQKKLFTQTCWKIIESRLRKGYHKEVFESMMNSQKKLIPGLTKGDKKEQVEKYFEEFAYKIVDRFYIPNYKAIFINNLYYEWDFEGEKPVLVEEYIKKEDLPLVIEALEGK